jgi:hypothetical protein
MTTVVRKRLHLSRSKVCASAGTRIADSPATVMAELKDKIKIALDESRMLVLGTQILLGFQFRSAFEPAFEQLPKSSQYLKMFGLMILLVAITLIMAPVHTIELSAPAVMPKTSINSRPR